MTRIDDAQAAHADDDARLFSAVNHDILVEVLSLLQVA